MTADEYRIALNGLAPEKFQQFRTAWGGAANRTIEECVQEFAYSTEIALWERTIIFRLRQQGVEGLKTEDEKALAIAERSATAAEASAVAAAQSASSAAGSSRAAWWALFISLLAIVSSMVVARGC